MEDLRAVSHVAIATDFPLVISDRGDDDFSVYFIDAVVRSESADGAFLGNDFRERRAFTKPLDHAFGGRGQ